MKIKQQETRKSTPSYKNKKGKSSAKSRKTKQSSIGKLLRSCPMWTIWAGMGIVAAAYVFLFYYFFVSPFSYRWRAIYGDPPFPEGYDIRGVDISHYQGKIDWVRLRNADVKNAPIRFIFIKATEGEEMLDSYFLNNFNSAKENDFITGAYHFYIPDASPEKQAALFIQCVKLEGGDLPPVLDVERRGKSDIAKFRRDILTWLKITERHYGVKPILYASTKFMIDYLDCPELKDYPFWIAHYYVDKLKYKGDWKFWQHTDCGKVDGIKGNVDLNIYNGKLSQLMQMTIPVDSTNTIKP